MYTNISNVCDLTRQKCGKTFAKFGTNLRIVHCPITLLLPCILEGGWSKEEAGVRRRLAHV